MAIKICLDCNQAKSTSEFYAQNKRGNLQSYCKTCSKARSKNYQKAKASLLPKRVLPSLDCLYCDTNFEPKKAWQITCSKKCGYMYQNSKKPRKIVPRVCMRCAIDITHKRANALYCSKTCCSMDHNFKHGSVTRVASVARRREIYLRDKGTCYICFSLVTFDAFEIDHLVPKSRGGDNSEQNLAVSCLKCNRSRGAKLGIRQLEKLSELRSMSEYH